MRKLSDDKIRHIVLLDSKGLGQAEIAKIVGVGVGSVNNYLKSKPAPQPSAPVAEDVPDNIPEGTDLATVDRWIPRVERMIDAADAAKDFGAASSLIAKLHSLLEHKRKATPPAPPDPNANPDFVEAARRARERLRKLIDTAVEK
jgi:hypothetical protein